MKIPRPFKTMMMGVVGLGTLGLAVVLIFFSFAVPNYPDPAALGKTLSHSLTNELSSAKEIRVVEHSSPWDYDPPEGHDFVEKVYATVVINAAQKDQLKTAVAPSLDYSATDHLMCIFEPHHRIEFVRTDNSIFKIELCFVCGQLDVGSGQRNFSEGWQPKLESFISSLSLRPHGPWRELAASANDRSGH